MKKAERLFWNKKILRGGGGEKNKYPVLSFMPKKRCFAK